MPRKIGILTGGGDAPGLNAVIRAFVKAATRDHDWTMVGVEDSYNGLMDRPKRLVPLDNESCRGLLHRGGTLLGTTNRGDPFGKVLPDGTRVDFSAELAASIREEGIEGLLTIGGDGSQAIALRLMQEQGVPAVGVPKTIDNDLSATDQTFGFQSAVDVATEALDRLHTTAESHERLMFLEVMGRDAGHIALSAGLAGGADVILLPEIPYDASVVAAAIRARFDRGRSFSIVVVAEGALPLREDGTAVPAAERKARLHRGNGAARIAMAQLEGRLEAEMRCCVLGHLQRGGSPVAFDRILATRFGVEAVNLIRDRRWGRMVCIRNGSVGSVPIEEATRECRLVDVDGELVHTARAIGVCLGA